MDEGAGAMSDEERRFEFRVWGDDLDEIAESIRNAGEPFDAHSRRETYLVTAWSAAVNVKIRDDELDVKTRGNVSHGFERWQVRHKSAFPIEAATAQREIFMRLGLRAPDCDRPVYTAAELRNELIAPHPALLAVDVTKNRTQYGLGAVTAEVTTVALEDAAACTVAIESTNLRALRSLRQRLGLQSRENLAYPQAIRRMLSARFDGS